MAKASTIENFHETSVIEEISLEALNIDRSYQRDPSQSLVEDIAAHWDEVASELVLVSNRGNGQGLWLVNGQHRSLAARKLGHETIWARIVDLSNLKDPAAVEAELRLKLNVKLGDRPLERFKAQVRAGDEDSLKIVKIMEKFDTQIASKMGGEGIGAISTVEAIFGQDPTGALLVETLEIIRDSFARLTGKVVSAAMLKGVAWFIEKHDAEVDRGRLHEKIASVGIEAIHRKAVTMQSVMGGSMWMNYYRTLVDIYNDGLHVKSRLEFRLRGANAFAARSKGGRVTTYA